jgi:hypothetical protein
MQVVKVTLSTKRVVLLRPIKISDTELAAQEVAAKSNGDSNLLQILMQKALVRNLLVKVDDKEPKPTDSMDDLFSISEYVQLQKVVRKMLGEDEGKTEPTLELVNFGS